MRNPFKGGSKNEFGATLPDDEAQLCEESERIQAHNQKQADKICEGIAEDYGGANPDAKAVGKSWFDCIFEVWALVPLNEINCPKRLLCKGYNDFEGKSLKALS